MKWLLTALLGFAGTINASSVKHLADAQLMQENVLPADNTYRNKDIEVIWKGDNGATKYICHADCSGLVDALFEHAYGFSKDELKQWIGGKRRPLSKHFFDTIIAERGFAFIEKIDDALPGDIIAIKFASGENDTGHTMLINEKPKLIESLPPLIENTKQWIVNIIDSTTHPHGPTDTRYINSKDHHNGIGKGNVRIYTDSNNRLVGYSWSTSSASTFIRKMDRPIAVGRLTRMH